MKASQEFRRDQWNVFINQPNGDTPDWASSPAVGLHPAANYQEYKVVVRDPVHNSDAGMVALGPENYGYLAPVDPNFVDSRPNPLSVYTDASTVVPGHILNQGDRFEPRRQS